MPYFSVVIPTFNCADRLDLALKSVLNQSFRDFEVLVMDDGSSDSTKEVVISFNDARIRYYWNPNSGGPATPRNLGMDLSQGDWISFLDADDIWYSNKLERVFDTIKTNNNIEGICHWENQRVIGEQKTKLLKHGPYEKEFYKNLLLEGNRLSPSATCVRRDFIQSNKLRFNQSRSFVIVEDYDFWLNLAKAGARFFFIEDPLGEYVLYGDNISSNSIKLFENLDTLLRHHVFNIQSFEDPNHLWKKLKTQIDLSKSKIYLKNGNFQKAIRLAICAFFSNPSIFIEKLLSASKRLFYST